MMAFWSLASMLHAAAAGAFGLMAFRFLLGLGEGGAFPAGAKAISEWFPRKERALAIGFINASLSLGGILAPPLTAYIAIRLGWRAAFLTIGSMGFLWLLVWLPFYRSPRQHRWLGPKELEYIDGGVREDPDEASAARPRDLLRFPQMWALFAARLVADPPWQFYLFWLPEYLRRVRGMNLVEIGMLAWLPFLAGAVGSSLGGWASGRLIRSGRDPVPARKIVMAASALLMPAGVAASLAPSGYWAIAWICVAAAGHNAWVSNAQTLPSDVLPARVVGTGVGISQMAGYCGNLAATLLTGYVLDRFSYLPIFVAASLLHPLATLILLAGFRRTDRVAAHFSGQSR